MDKTIGIPRGLYYYSNGFLLKAFFRNLGFKVLISPETTRFIYEMGEKIANDEMCSALKIFLGHVFYLKDKVDYILIPRIDNYGIDNQTCTNFLAIYDLVYNLFDIPLLNYNIDYTHHQLEYDGLYKISRSFGLSSTKIHAAYKNALLATKVYEKEKIRQNKARLYSKNTKVLLVSHPYVIKDAYLGKNILAYLQKQNIDYLFASEFSISNLEKEASYYADNLYWKVCKEQIAPIHTLEENIDGIIFVSSFPCGLDSLVNELVLRKVNIPKINLILDDVKSFTGIETRLESFLDILTERKKKCLKK